MSRPYYQERDDVGSIPISHSGRSRPSSAAGAPGQRLDEDNLRMRGRTSLMPPPPDPRLNRQSVQLQTIRDPRLYRDRNNQRVRQPGSRLPQSLPSVSPKATPKVPNDCEIIVVGKKQQQYGERIERTLKEMGLKVDLMFPKPDITIQTFIDNIVTLGAGFAVVVKNENEMHQSLTVHVLKGVPKPEEHRNMPLAAAYSLMKERFDQIRRSDFGTACARFREQVNLILDSHFLTDSEYQYVIKYVHERWRKQKVLENKHEYDPETGMNSPHQIQQKLLKLLGLDSARRVYVPPSGQQTAPGAQNNQRDHIAGTSHSMQHHRPHFH